MFYVHVEAVIAEHHKFVVFCFAVQSSFSTQSETFFTCSMMLCLHITSKLMSFFKIAVFLVYCLFVFFNVILFS